VSWIDILAFARGPFFYASLLVFIAGMAYRVVAVVLLGWKRDRVPNNGSKLRGVAITYAKGLGVLPFVPWVKHTFNRAPVTFMAGGLFHLGLLVVIFLGAAHMLVWKSLLGFGWPTLPLPIVDWLAAASIAAMVALGVNRAVNPVLKLISGPAEWASLLVVFLPMLTGYAMTHHLFFRYEVLYSLHMIAVNVMLIYIPFSRISHFVFYFFSRTFHGAQAGKRAVMP
jgi:nitrate reductase gamma subunit